MKQNVLVAYASTHGAMQEVAEVMAATLCEKGFIVDARLARNVQQLDEYSAVVLGAPLYMMRWHKDAMHFLAQHRKALSSGLPLAVFAGGPYVKDDPADWREVRGQIDRELAKFPWLRPVAVEVVGGKFDPHHLRFPWNLIPALKQQPASDLRNWDTIRTWASELGVRFATSHDAQTISS